MGISRRVLPLLFGPRDAMRCKASRLSDSRPARGGGNGEDDRSNGRPQDGRGIVAEVCELFRAFSLVNLLCTRSLSMDSDFLLCVCPLCVSWCPFVILVSGFCLLLTVVAVYMVCHHGTQCLLGDWGYVCRVRGGWSAVAVVAFPALVLLFAFDA